MTAPKDDKRKSPFFGAIGGDAPIMRRDLAVAAEKLRNLADLVENEGACFVLVVDIHEGSTDFHASFLAGSQKHAAQMLSAGLHCLMFHDTGEDDAQQG